MKPLDQRQLRWAAMTQSIAIFTRGEDSDKQPTFKARAWRVVDGPNDSLCHAELFIRQNRC